MWELTWWSSGKYQRIKPSKSFGRSAGLACLACPANDRFGRMFLAARRVLRNILFAYVCRHATPCKPRVTLYKTKVVCEKNGSSFLFFSAKMSWCTIESDPGVFGELIAKLGVKEVGVEEVYTLDSLIESQVQTPDLQYGLIFLFKWKKEDDNRATIPFDESAMENTVYFARQVIQDACATQALISILMNAPISLGVLLTESLFNIMTFV